MNASLCNETCANFRAGKFYVQRYGKEGLVNGGANLVGNLALLQVIQSLLTYHTFNFMENFLSCFCCNADVVLREVEGAPIGLYHLVCIKVKAADPKLE